MTGTPGTAPVLEVSGLTTQFTRYGRTSTVVDDVSFHINRGETLGLVGESGSGKSVTALSLVDLIAKPAGKITAGTVMFGGRDLRTLTAQQMQAVRGAEIGFVFQDPMSSLNPTLTVGFQVAEPLRRHQGLSKKQAAVRAAEMLARVGIAHPHKRLNDYPHQFSGGMRQRVMIAIALACDPQLIIADEPTTALDVTVQAQILELLTSLSSELGTSVLLITHDLGVAAGICDRINVMYAGQIVESAPVAQEFAHPQMPYTSGLLRCLPRIDDDPDSLFEPIPGGPPNLLALPPGCRFAPRCPHAREVCRQENPQLTARGNSQTARCWGTEPGGWVS